jgi:hypothetical protein
MTRCTICFGELMLMGLPRCFYIRGSVCAALVFVAAICTAGSAKTEDAPALLLSTRSIYLKTCGWEPEQLVVHHTGYVPLKLAFDHQGNLWSGYTTKMLQVVPRTAPELGEQYNLVELSGTPVKCAVRMSLPTTISSPVAIIISNNNSLLTVANDQLHLIDQKDFKEHAAFNLLRPSDQARYKIMQSAGRKSLVVVTEGLTKTDSSYTWLDPDTLQVRHTCSYPPFKNYGQHIGVRSFADDGRFTELDYDESRHPVFWLAGGLYCSPKANIPPDHIQPVAVILLNSQTAYFLDNLLNDNLPSIVVYDRAGVLLHTVSGHDKETMAGSNGVVISEDGRRVAVAIDITAGGIRWLDISNHVAARRVDIYDTTTWTRIAEIKLSSQGEAGLAFSPDGKTLAIQTEDLIQFYDGVP